MRNQNAKWTNSEASYNLVVGQIKKKWGKDEVTLHNPKQSCFTFSKWLKHGYTVKKGEKAIKTYSVLYIQNEDNQVIATLQIPVNVFYRKQVAKLMKK